jgi:ribosomal protein S18 acetylase RimI-like enzyme
MISVQLLIRLDSTDIKRIASGYTADGTYSVMYTDSAHATAFNLQYVTRKEPYVKQYDHFDDETLQRYNRMFNGGYSFGAYDDGLLVGLLIAEPYEWNGSLAVWEFHVAETHRRRGIGRQLMECAAAKATHAGLRTIVCETQATNVPSIMVYRSLGFRIEGVDISYYSNTDYPDGEIAVFMKRRLE